MTPVYVYKAAPRPSVAATPEAMATKHDRRLMLPPLPLSMHAASQVSWLARSDILVVRGKTCRVLKLRRVQTLPRGSKLLRLKCIWATPIYCE